MNRSMTNYMGNFLPKRLVVQMKKRTQIVIQLTGLTFCLLLFAPYLSAQETAVAETKDSFWLWNFLGRLHPLAVHFPVGLLLFAACMELFTLKRFDSPLRPGIRVSLWVGVISAILSAVFGWLLANTGDYGSDTLTLHQWTGIATAALGALTIWLLPAGAGQRRAGGIKTYRLVLFSAAAGIMITGHLGASITHGEDYLSSTLPWNSGSDYGYANFDLTPLKNDTTPLSPEQAHDLNIQVKGIFAHNCNKCHGAEKVKGDLRLDIKDMVFRGGESGPLFTVGNPSESEIIRRITLPANHEDVMPSKGKKLSSKEVDIISVWIAKGAPWPDDSSEHKTFRIAELKPRNPDLPAGTQDISNPVDRWVNDYFAKHNIPWQEVVDDRIYLRRIYLDIIGLLPSPEALREFTEDNRPDKRAQMVRTLLSRSDDYAIHWLTFWNDALRNDYSGTGYIDGGRSNITGWLYSSLKNNKPYNTFVEELINPDNSSAGFINGIKWRGVVNASQRPEMQAAQNVSQVFLGLNLKCASCHNSFINQWTLEDAYAFANVFSDSSLEINRCDVPTGKYTDAKLLWSELGEIDQNADRIEKQRQLAALITQPSNGRIYRTIVNRVWAKLMGRGLVEPVDVMDNEPWSQDLLDWLAYDFAREDKFDTRELIYLITTSKTYQLPSVGLDDVSDLTAADYTFTGMVRRRLTAEQFADAVGTVAAPVFADSRLRFTPFTVGNESASPMIKRAALVENNGFLTALGRPNRETVSTGRESQANLLQALELTNGDRFAQALKKGAERWKEQYPDSNEMIREIYLKALGRTPLPAELDAARAVLGETPGIEAVEDLLWAVLLLPEFQLIF